jgi:dihydroorotate dehydrogenase electron transfer subunit
LLRRALAVYRKQGHGKLSFLYQVLGRGTQALSRLEPLTKVDLLVPLGNGWLDPIPGWEHATPRSRTSRAIVVSGGVGSASVLALCEELAAQGTETEILFGASSEEVARGCGLDDFHRLGLPIEVTTDDGSLGERGFVTVPLERRLRDGAGEGATIYACGPWVMMRRVAEIAEQFSIDCLVSLEAPMGCGFGVCVGCVVAVKGSGGYDAYKRVCIDGSVFPAQLIRWDVIAMHH